MWEYQKTKREWSQIIRTAIKEKPVEPLKKAVVHIHYVFADKRRRDPDNYSGKMILDAIVKHGMIEDDSFSNIELKLSASYQKGVKQTRVRIEDNE